MHGIGDGVGIERIDDQSLGEVLRRAGELRQHQHTRILVGLRGHELLGDEVHAVPQGRHDADPTEAIESSQGRSRRAARRIAQRRPVELREAAIDAAGKPVEFGAQLAILIDLLTRARTDL